MCNTITILTDFSDLREHLSYSYTQGKENTTVEKKSSTEMKIAKPHFELF